MLLTKLNFVILISLSYCVTANAQAELTKSVVASSGGNFTNGTLTISSTVAEMTMVKTLSVSGIDLFQGFQNNAWMIQEVYVNPGANNELAVALFPNPANTFINFEVTDRNPGKLTIVLNDILGRTVRIISVPELQSQMQLDINELPAGLYAMAVLNQTNQKVFNQTISVIH